MHAHHDVFLNSIHAKRKVRLTFMSKQDGAQLVRVCAPMDFGPKRRAKDSSNRYHFWDFESDTHEHTLSLLPVQIVSIQAIPDGFEPGEFITWDVGSHPWFVARDWGAHS